mgnify:CR=1 FL=1
MLIFVQNLSTMKKVVFLLSIIVFSAVACQSQNTSKETAATAKSEVLSVADFKTKTSDSKVQLVDVRTPEEYVQGHIDEALNINVLADNFSTEIQKMDKTKPVYIYCRSGSRSARAAKAMQELGFKEIYDLKGGYLAWSAQQ